MNTPDNTFTDIRKNHWLFRILPDWLIPYGLMARWDRPIGWWLLWLPCLWGLSLGVLNMSLSNTHGFHSDSMNTVLQYAFIFWIGAVAMRGAGCVWNDITDRHLDGSVERTRHRPLPSGLITVPKALIFMAIQMIVGLWVLSTFPLYAVYVTLSSVILIIIYPFMKRITYFPQVILGLAFNWGVWVGYTAMGYTLSIDDTITWVVVLVYGAGVFWTIAYDTIYALQDIKDDQQTGIKSTAIRFKNHPKTFVGGMYGSMIALLISALWLAHSNPMAYMGIGALALQFYSMVIHIDPTSQQGSLRLFKANKLSGILVVCILVIAGTPVE